MAKLVRCVVITVIGTALLTPVAPRAAIAADPFGSTPCDGVRPGALIEAPPGSIYTMGYVLKGIDAKGRSATYVTTVGNYVLPTAGVKTWVPNTGPEARDGLGKAFGRFVYATQTDTPAFTTFGLVLVDRKIKANPQVCHFGGPTGAYEATESLPFAVQYYGQGIPAVAVVPARTALVSGASDPESTRAQGLVGPGDEGGPVQVDGAALGFLDGGIGVPGFVVSRLNPWIVKVQKALKLKLQLLTAPTL